MDIFVKQSLTCVWRDLTTSDYHTYSYYDKGQRLVAEHHACTTSQLDQGYMIEIAILAVIFSVIIGWLQKGESKYSHTASWLGGLIAGVIGTIVLNILISGFGPIMFIVSGILFLCLMGWFGNKMKTPYAIWKDVQAAKDRAAHVRLKAAQEEIARLRASDPLLDEALRSLDRITTALHE